MMMIKTIGKRHVNNKKLLQSLGCKNFLPCNSPRSPVAQIVHERECGKLADEEGLPTPTDWTQGWIYSWTGRRSNIQQDICSGNVSLFAGHTMLITNMNKTISFLPHPISYDDTNLQNVADAVIRRDRHWLEGNVYYKPCLDVNQAVNDPVLYRALQANGIIVKKAEVLYSPSMLSRVYADENFLNSCKYSWNIDVEKRFLNCNTFFQAWNIIKNVPFLEKQSDFNSYLDANLNAEPLTVHEKEQIIIANNAKDLREGLFGDEEIRNFREMDL